MSSKPRKFASIIDLLEAFPTEKACSQHVAQQRWGDTVVCPYCNHKKVYKFANGIKYKCAACRRNFSVRVGTIMEDSNIPLRKWFVAIYLDTSHKKGISSHQLARDLNVCQKTAWFMLQRIRNAMSEESPEPMFGIMEADETMIGGLERNKHASKRTPGTQGRSMAVKCAVVGVISHKGEVRAQPVPDVAKETLHAFIMAHVKPKSVLMTDTWKGYNGLKAVYSHLRVNHSQGEYARGFVTTNRIENFWSLLARGIVGIYHHVSPKHLHRYIDEFTFRFNTREISTQSRFDFFLSNISGTLPYKTLIAKP